MNNEAVIFYDEFVEYVKDSVSKFYGTKYVIDVKQVQKNNGVLLDGIIVRLEGENIAPTIYLNPYYEKYKETENINQIVMEIIDTVDENRLKESLDVSFYNDISWVRENIMYKLINYEKNKELLTQVPHRVILDLAIVYTCCVQNRLIGNGSILVRNEHMKQWGEKEDSLFLWADNNLKSKTIPHLMGMHELIEKMGRDEIEHFEDEEEKMYVLTNENGINGAVCILRNDVLYDLSAKTESDLYILPSSIHETILVPAKIGVNPECLRNMVSDVNSSVVHAEEILSDEVYYYNRENKKLSVCM